MELQPFYSHNINKYNNELKLEERIKLASCSQWYENRDDNKNIIPFKVSKNCLIHMFQKINSEKNIENVLSKFSQNIEYIEFLTAEHGMMACKIIMARLHGVDVDNIIENFKTIIDSKDIKQLGRNIPNFELWGDDWVKYGVFLVSLINVFKFRDLNGLPNKGFLVEASKYDKIWGIGFSEENMNENKNEWGKNLLGIALESAKQFDGLKVYSFETICEPTFTLFFIDELWAEVERNIRQWELILNE